MASFVAPPPEGIFSLLDTDLYKLTMQSAVLKYFPQVDVTYSFTNRTPDMKLSRDAFKWLQVQIERLGNIRIRDEEIQFLQKNCPYLSEAYLHYLRSFQMKPGEHIRVSFTPDSESGSDEDKGDVELHVAGLWVETILYEIPLLALTSEAYFKFCDRDWSYDGQVAKAKEKGLKLLEHGCVVSEFGARRRRDYHTQELVLQGLMEAQKEGEAKGYNGKITGTSNVHFAMKFGVQPIGTVAHEWFMGVAAVTDAYPSATETALRYWIGCFGKGVLGIALTDTFGTPHFLEAFKQPIPPSTIPDTGAASTLSSSAAPTAPSSTISTTPPVSAEAHNQDGKARKQPTERYADVFVGTRQDSGDPLEFVKTMRAFYDREGVEGKKTIVFSDSLNVDRCIEYREAAVQAGFQPSFGVGTFLTNDYTRASDGKKSAPLNIVIKISSANGKPAVKISDNIGKNTGDSATVAEIKRKLGYKEHEWADGDERTRWGGEVGKA